MKLTEKQERFAAEVAKGLNYSAAYKIAYPVANAWDDRSVWNKASELARHGGVMARVEELRRPSIEAAQYGVTEAMAETDRYLAMAAEDRQWGPVSAMLKHKAQLNALLVNKLEVGGAGDFAKFDARQKITLMESL